MTHPREGVIAYPKYVVDPTGDRVDRNFGIRYRRLQSLNEEHNYVMNMYRRYVKFDDFYGRDVVVVPLNDIVSVYNPIEKLKEISSLKIDSDPVLKDVKDMVLDIIDSTKVKDVGVSGSVLVDLYKHSSDIDVVVYGMENGLRVYKYLSEVIDRDARYRRYTVSDIHELFHRRSLETPIAFEQLVKQESRKVLEGFFRGREYFIRLVKYPWEEPSYGSYRCVKLGKTLAKLRVIDDKESIYTPCRYRVELLEIVKGDRVDIEEIYSLRGRFAEVARQDDVVIAFGTIERIEMSNGKIYHRLYLGDEGDYLLLTK